jgi:hypothetical protein
MKVIATRSLGWQPVVIGFGVPHDWTSGEGHDTNAARTLKSRLRKRPVYGEVVPRLAKWFPYWTDPEVLRRIPIASQRKL